MRMFTSKIDESQLGICPLGVMIVGMFVLFGLAIYIDPESSFFNVKMGLLIFASLAWAAFVKINIKKGINKKELKKTFWYAFVGAGCVGFLTYVLDFTWWPLTMLTASGLLALAAPPVFEELFFRHGMFIAFQRWMGVPLAMVIQALFFAVFHAWVGDFFTGGDLSYLGILFFGGMVLQIVYLLSKNLTASILAHMIINLRPYFFIIVTIPAVAIIALIAFVVFYLRRDKKV